MPGNAGTNAWEHAFNTEMKHEGSDSDGGEAAIMMAAGVASAQCQGSKSENEHEAKLTHVAMGGEKDIVATAIRN